MDIGKPVREHIYHLGYTTIWFSLKDYIKPLIDKSVYSSVSDTVWNPISDSIISVYQWR